jgi:hypothetical protein
MTKDKPEKLLVTNASAYFEGKENKFYYIGTCNKMLQHFSVTHWAAE